MSVDEFWTLTETLIETWLIVLQMLNVLIITIRNI